MRKLLIIVFSAILVGMLYVTIAASFDRGVLVAGAELWTDPWFKATLADAYFGFITFFVWVAYKERSNVNRFVWFVLIMALGNIAMSIYMIIKLSKMEAGDSIETLLLKRKV